MDKFELYMIDNIKAWSDMVRSEENEEVRWGYKNVLMELISALVQYEGATKGIEYRGNDNDIDDCEKLIS